MSYVDPDTGQIYDASEWIIHEFEGKVTKVRRLSDKQLAYIESLERQLGYQPKSHRNMPAYKAVKHIERLKQRLEARKLQDSLI
jgi:hypothetical protein